MASTAAFAKLVAQAAATQQRWRGNRLLWRIHHFTTKTVASTTEKAAREPV